MKRYTYITRIDSGTNHTWWVRIGSGTAGAVQKSFPDKRHGGKNAARQAAIAWRDKALKTFPKKYLRDHGTSSVKGKIWGRGYNLYWKLSGNYYYLIVQTSFHDRTGRKFSKTFSCHHLGYKKAIRMAKWWRRQYTRGRTRIPVNHPRFK